MRRTWWHAGRSFSAAELIADIIVHSVGIFSTLAASSILVFFLASRVSPEQLAATSVYVGTLVAVLSISLIYNLWPRTSFKRLLARCDQAAIFLLIAGTYTQFLLLISGTAAGSMMMALVWGSAFCGVALKLIAPHSFGRFSIVIYLIVGASGVLVFQALAKAIPPAAIWLLAVGAIIYAIGIIFHLWEKLRFQTALWHLFVVVAAMLHFGAVAQLLPYRMS